MERAARWVSSLRIRSMVTAVPVTEANMVHAALPKIMTVKDLTRVKSPIKAKTLTKENILKKSIDLMIPVLRIPVRAQMKMNVKALTRVMDLRKSIREMENPVTRNPVRAQVKMVSVKALAKVKAHKKEKTLTRVTALRKSISEMENPVRMNPVRAQMKMNVGALTKVKVHIKVKMATTVQAHIKIKMVTTVKAQGKSLNNPLSNRLPIPLKDGLPIPL